MEVKGKMFGDRSQVEPLGGCQLRHGEEGQRWPKTLPCSRMSTERGTCGSWDECWVLDEGPLLGQTNQPGSGHDACDLVLLRPSIQPAGLWRQGRSILCQANLDVALEWHRGPWRRTHSQLGYIHHLAQCVLEPKVLYPVAAPAQTLQMSLKVNALLMLSYHGEACWLSAQHQR